MESRTIATEQLADTHERHGADEPVQPSGVNRRQNDTEYDDAERFAENEQCHNNEDGAKERDS